MTIPSIVKCPICGKKMDEMLPVDGQDISLSTVSAKIEVERKHLKTIVYICENCHNVQSFIQFES